MTVDAWPTCPKYGHGLLGMVLTCTLPEHHAHDGDEWHHDPTGARWRYVTGDDVEPERFVAVLS